MPYVYNPFTGTFDFTSSTAAPSGPAGGDLSGTYPNPTVSKINGVAYDSDPLAQYAKLSGRAGTANDLLISTGGTGTLCGSSALGGELVILANNTASSTGQISLLPNLSGDSGTVQIFSSDVYINSGAAPHQLWLFSNASRSARLRAATGMAADVTSILPAGQGANHTTLHNDGTGQWSWALVGLTTDVTGTLPLGNLPGTLLLTDGTRPLIADWNAGAFNLTAQLRDKGGQVYNVKAYGAVGDGVADDTAAIQSAINAATLGGTIFFPSGDYVITSALSINNHNLWLLGSGHARSTAGDRGTRLVISAAVDGIDVVGVSGGRMGLRIERLSLISNHVSAGSAIKLGDATSGTVEAVIKDIHVEPLVGKAWAKAIEFVKAQNTVVEDSFLFGNVGNGITDVISLDGTSQGNTFMGVSITGKAASGTATGVTTTGSGAEFFWYGGVVQGGFTTAAFNVVNAGGGIFGVHLELTSGNGDGIRYDNSVFGFNVSAAVVSVTGTGRAVNVGPAANAWDFGLFGGKYGGGVTANTFAQNAMLWPDQVDGTLVDSGSNTFIGQYRTVGQGTPNWLNAPTLTTGGGKFTVGATGNITKLNNVTQSWPASQGANNTTLHNDGTGALAWSPVALATDVTGLLPDANLATSYIKADGTRPLSADWAVGSHKLTGLLDPSALQDAATKGYVDQVAGGLGAREARLATAAALPANTYFNGVGGVGATLTATANGALTVDGVLVASGDRVLVKNEAATANNGIYVVTATGSAILPYILTRAIDSDDSDDFAGVIVLIIAGTANANTAWFAAAGASIVVGTDPIVFSQYQVGQGTTVGGDLTGTVGNATVAKINGVAYNADPLSQYFLLAGRSGGQIGNGGTGASDALTLRGSSGATGPLSHILLNDLGQGFVGIGLTSPGASLDVEGFPQVGAGTVSSSFPGGLVLGSGGQQWNTAGAVGQLRVGDAIRANGFTTYVTVVTNNTQVTCVPAPSPVWAVGSTYTFWRPLAVFRDGTGTALFTIGSHGRIGINKAPSALFDATTAAVPSTSTTDGILVPQTFSITPSTGGNTSFDGGVGGKAPVGGSAFRTAGGGSATGANGTGGAGEKIVFQTGGGGSAGTGTGTGQGGAGGSIQFLTGGGGSVAGLSSTGGNSAGISFLTGGAGNDASTDTGGMGGTGGPITLSSGAGGASTLGTGGLAGAIIITAGSGGNGGLANGVGGNVSLEAGNPGTGTGTVATKGRIRMGFQNSTAASIFTAVCGADAAPTTGGQVHLVPSYTPTVGAAGNVDAGTHLYKITYTSIFGETLASFPSAQINPGVASQVTVQLPIGPPGTTGRNVYRTKSGNTVSYFLISASPMVNNNTATTYTDNTADASLTATTPPGSDTSKINPSVLEVQSTQEAFLLPRMTTTQRDAMLALDGMMIYNTSAGVAAAQVHQNGAWVSF